ncbi:hypothetical protein CC86DRAFT_471177 [Ophiobolus disseminans]|uniref:Uncharacterized protein n=1 Tax=Ophiobolus disseminans TaxID=1469910 RepID=A0A6A6ZK13_9PLEO|nr:hypothetical protein CC86DRAFT_471177 [Ophiobolus disseminans]
MSHKSWVTKWRLAKIRFQRELELLEEFQEEHPLLAEECGVPHTLQTWQLENENCSIVPGYKYVSIEKQKVENETEMKVAVEADPSLSAQETEDLWVDNREWVIKPKRKSRRRRTILEDKPRLRDILAISFTAPPDHTPGPDDQVLEEMENVTARLEAQVNIGS